MLGQEIIIDACTLGYYDKPAGETQFKLNSDDNDHTIIGSNSELISCNELKGINVTGPKVSNAKKHYNKPHFSFWHLKNNFNRTKSWTITMLPWFISWW